MKKTLILATIGVILFSIFLVPLKQPIYAAEACPASMPIQERYLCLQKELEKLESSQGSLQKKLKNEDYQQLSLSEKLSYITTQIAQTEKIISTLSIEITAQDIEISLLTEEIKNKEDGLSILNQEIKVLEETVNERVRQSYKYSYVGALELFFDVKNFDSIIRKTKYLIETRLRDKDSLLQYENKMDDLEQEELLLANNKAQLQIKRNDIEGEKERLTEEKVNLDSQKTEKASLLAQSQKREADYKAQLSSVTAALSTIDDRISEVSYELFKQGLLGNGTRIAAGQTIAYQGHTGCSYGSHLHFDIRNASGTRIDPIPTYLSYSGGYVYANKYLAPLRSAYRTQDYSSSHRALDLVSLSDGNQNYEKYTVPGGLCPIVDNLIATRGNQAYLTGEGAPIKAISSGKVYYGVESTWGGKYALVKHDDGFSSFYLHIR